MSKKTLWFISVILGVLISIVGLVLLAFGHVGWGIVCAVIVFFCVIGILYSDGWDHEYIPRTKRNIEELEENRD